MKFSDRYGYTTPSNVLIREKLDKKCINGLCTCFDYLELWLNEYDSINRRTRGDSYSELEEHIWCFFCNERKDNFMSYNGYQVTATAFLENPAKTWYEKFNLIEFALDYLRNTNRADERYQGCVDLFVNLLNKTLRRFDLSYRIVNNQIVEITDKEEIVSIEEALKVSNNIRLHISGALRHLSSKPIPDYRNSIKESISAVEGVCRDITGANTLGDALKNLERKGVLLPRMLQVSFEKLYAYTNDQKTGIRHALIEEQENPGFDEAKFMLVTCCAFINYIQSKRNI